MKSKQFQSQRYRTMYGFSVLAFLVILSGLSHAAMIDSSRIITWQGNVGVVGGIPNRTNVRDCVNDIYPGKGTFSRNLIGDDRPAIIACIDSLSAEQVAYLPAGNYRLNSSLNIGSKNNITLRGASPSLTKLYFYGNSGSGGYINISGVGQFDPPNHTATWSAGYTKSSNKITLSTVTNLSVGSVLALDQVDDNTSLVWTVGGNGSAQFTRNNNSRHLTQFVSVIAIDTSTKQVTIDPPLYTNYSSEQFPGAYWWESSITGVGVEDLSIDPSNDAVPPDYNIDIQYAQNIWFKNIESYLAKRAHFHTFRTKSIVLRDSYFHHSRAYASQSYGTELWHTSCALVENNIFSTLTAPLLLAAGASGNVFGYNYIPTTKYDTQPSWLSQSASVHAAHGFMNLFEGNITSNIYLDNTWGSNSHTTIFRNALSGWQAGKTANTFPIVFEAHSRYNNVVGNVLGENGYHDIYEVYNTPYSGSSSIYVLGYWSPDTTNLTKYDLTVYDSLLRHMNFDFVSGEVKYCDTDGGAGCQQGDASTKLPKSLYLSSKPSWYGTGCTWPPVDPSGPTVSNIPAKLRHEGSSCPEDKIPSQPLNLR